MHLKLGLGLMSQIQGTIVLGKPRKSLDESQISYHSFGPPESLSITFPNLHGYLVVNLAVRRAVRHQ
jgi:hypothetical protein